MKVLFLTLFEIFSAIPFKSKLRDYNISTFEIKFTILLLFMYSVHIKYLLKSLIFLLLKYIYHNFKVDR